MCIRDSDWSIGDGLAEIPIETRSPREVTHIRGAQGGQPVEAMLTPEGSPGLNPAFDVTPARLVTALITERGVVAPSEADLKALYAGS